jgi:2-amino-4-hydroxy-6-hydroxymethyldihydropteridine diphosphokinase
VLNAANRCVIGLGANLGDRVATFESALTRMAQWGSLQAVSRLFETAPVGGPVQPDYYNAAACLLTRLPPRDLLRELLGIERKHGRIRDKRWGPRPLDLDILWLEGVVVAEPGLQVPHARLTERAFALIPLLDVVPDARDPVSGQAYRDHPVVRDTVGIDVRGIPGLSASILAGDSLPSPLWTLC